MIKKHYITGFESRKVKRQILRSVGFKIGFYGNSAYREAKRMLGLRESASIFDLDSDTLAQLGQAIKDIVQNESK